MLPPGTPKDRVEVLQDAFRKTYRDPEFHKDFVRLVGDEAEPLMPEELAKVIREIPREVEVVELLSSLAGARPLPSR
jgi:tripartite-type tricarboxylate transporter receptor subunit TctC